MEEELQQLREEKHKETLRKLDMIQRNIEQLHEERRAAAEIEEMNREEETSPPTEKRRVTRPDVQQVRF